MLVAEVFKQMMDPDEVQFQLKLILKSIPASSRSKRLHGENISGRVAQTRYDYDFYYNDYNDLWYVDFQEDAKSVKGYNRACQNPEQALRVFLKWYAELEAKGTK